MTVNVASLSVETVALEKILVEAPGWDMYRRRRRLHVDEMARSVRERGELSPVLLEESPGDSCRIVDGFRRVAACRALGRNDIAAQVVRDKGITRDALFLIGLARNVARGGCPLTDIIVTVAAARRLGFSPERAVQEILPLLGMKPDIRLMADLERLAELPDEILDAFDDDRISEAQLRALAGVKEPARGILFREVFFDSRLSVSETRQVVALLEELSARDDCPMERNLAMLLEGDLDGRPPERARRLLSRLRLLRYPSISTYKSMFKEAAASLRSARGVSVGDPGEFERNDVTVSLTFGKPEELAAQLDAMRKALDAGDVKKLVDIVQGVNG